MSLSLSEDIVEHAGIGILKQLGKVYLPGAAIAPEGPASRPR